jgi:hypothetical protein
VPQCSCSCWRCGCSCTLPAPCTLCATRTQTPGLPWPTACSNAHGASSDTSVHQAAAAWRSASAGCREDAGTGLREGRQQGKKPSRLTTIQCSHSQAVWCAWHVVLSACGQCCEINTVQCVPHSTACVSGCHRLPQALRQESSRHMAPASRGPTAATAAESAVVAAACLPS